MYSVRNYINQVKDNIQLVRDPINKQPEDPIDWSNDARRTCSGGCIK